MKYFYKFEDYEELYNNFPIINPKLILVKRAVIGDNVKKDRLYFEHIYDEQINYIESTGTQCIDLPVKIRQGDYFEIVLDFTNNTTETNKQLFNSNVANAFVSRTYSYSAPNMTFSSIISNNATSGGFTFPVDTRRTLLLSTTHVNGTALNRPIGSGYSFTKLTLLANKGGVSCQIYECKIKQNRNLIYDLIPVVRNSVGYLYDKISKQLFGNAGVGDFKIN